MRTRIRPKNSLLGDSTMMTPSALRAAGLVLFAAASACTPSVQQQESVPKVDAHYSTILDGRITDGVVLVPSATEPERFVEAIRKQLRFSIGQLNTQDSSTDAGRTEITVTQSAPYANDNAWLEVHYTTQFLVAWAAELTAPARQQLIMPAKVELDGSAAAREFHTAFGSTNKCVSAEATSEHTWHDWAPRQTTCPLRSLTQSTAATSAITNVTSILVARVPMRLTNSTRATTGKKPEYARVWADGALIVTIVFGKDGVGATSSSDWGIVEFRNTYQALVNTYGAPTQTSLTAGSAPDAAHPFIQAEFATESGKLIANLILTDGVREGDEAFERNLKATSADADLIIYSGHSGYGANLQALVALANFKPAQYQVFLIDGCLSFSYLDQALRDRHAALNPNTTPYKFVDIIANAMPAPWGVGTTNNMAVINGLVGKSKTYRQILQGLDESSRGVVWGEEDNDE